MQQGPWNRWAFRNLRRLLRTANVWRGDAPVRHLESRPAQVDDVGFTGRHGAGHTVGGLLARGFAGTLVVLHRGAIVCGRYAEGVDAHEPHLLMSVTKSFAATLFAFLAEDGLVSPADRVTDILPERGGSAYGGRPGECSAADAITARDAPRHAPPVPVRGLGHPGGGGGALQPPAPNDTGHCGDACRVLMGRGWRAPGGARKRVAPALLPHRLNPPGAAVRTGAPPSPGRSAGPRRPDRRRSGRGCGPGGSAGC